MKQIAIITIILALILNYSWIKEINQIVNYLSWQNENSQENISQFEYKINLIKKVMCKKYPDKAVAFVWKRNKKPTFQNIPYMEAISFPCIKGDNDVVFSNQKNLIIIGDK